MSDYIDRELAIENVISQMRCSKSELCMRERLLNLEAADVRPVVHGHWYWDKNGIDWGLGAWRCSVCHSKNDNVFGPETHPPMRCAGSKFCPNCGAKMEAGE